MTGMKRWGKALADLATFTGRRKGLLLFSLFSALFLILGGIVVDNARGQEGAPSNYKPSKPTPEQVEAGKAVYFRKCVWCHGPDGAGDGPSAQRLSTKPRNFNAGTFKIRHTASGELPTDEDLFLTVTNGLPGSVMPPWGDILSEQERKDVIAFVKTVLVKDRKFDDPEEEFHVISYGKQVPSSAESIKRGREVFMDKGKCRECHGDEGRGNGNLTMKDDWQFPIFPADLTHPWNIRGNRRDPYNPKNIFREVSTGLNGTPMPSFIDTLNEQERWDVANFVMSLTPVKYKIDPQTMKPALSFVLKSKYTKDAQLPTDANDKRWGEMQPYYIGMASQIIRQPRHFIRTIEDVEFRSMFNDKEIVFLFQWDDRTKSLRDENKEPVYDTVRVKSTDLTHEENPPTYKGVYNDAVAIQIPEKWEDLPSPEKPYFIHGDAKRGVDIWKWEADGAVHEITGHGISDLKERDTKDVTVSGATWKNGQWSIVMHRALHTKDKEHDAQFELGKYIPVTFFAWDGDAGEVGGKMALSTYYYVMLEPLWPTKVYVIPPIVGAFVLLAEGFVFWKVRKGKKEEGKGRR
ncbi:MAG TPA: c-type cytochrome [Nitrospiria bacterium]|nr:c-type cytochrome [Nitrospiria bacterium]